MLAHVNSVYIYIYTHMFIYVCVCVYIYVYVYLCVYIYVEMYIYISAVRLQSNRFPAGPKYGLEACLRGSEVWAPVLQVVYNGSIWIPN